jgi:Ran GTPase-activating protein (RanGAP) involved in mRNA processing and transport
MTVRDRSPTTYLLLLIAREREDIMEDQPVIVYHVFSDHIDSWYRKLYQAQANYNRLCETEDNVRLYQETYEDEDAYENDEMESEDCLMCKGLFPS